PNAVKTGMLGNAAIVEAVAATIEELELPNLVVDPVMVAKGGSRLLEDDAVAAVGAGLLPPAGGITPHIPPTDAPGGFSVRTLDDMREAGRRIRKLGPRVVIIKGGPLPPSGSDPDLCVDVVSSRPADFDVRGPRIATRHTHGTGCTFSAAIAAALALGQPLEQ